MAETIISIRIYRQFDRDLYDLMSMGYRVGEMMEAVFHARAEGKTMEYRVEKIISVSDEHKSYFRLQFPIHSEAARKLKKSIIRGNVNQYCKQLLRNSLTYIPLNNMFLDEDRQEEEARFLEESLARSDVIPVYPGVRVVTKAAAQNRTPKKYDTKNEEKEAKHESTENLREIEEASPVTEQKDAAENFGKEESLEATHTEASPAEESGGKSQEDMINELLMQFNAIE